MEDDVKEGFENEASVAAGAGDADDEDEVEVIELLERVLAFKNVVADVEFVLVLRLGLALPRVRNESTRDSTGTLFTMMNHDTIQ